MIVLLDGIYFLVGSVFWKHEKRIFLERVVGRHIFWLDIGFGSIPEKKIPERFQNNSRKTPGSFRKLSASFPYDFRKLSL